MYLAAGGEPLKREIAEPTNCKTATARAKGRCTSPLVRMLTCAIIAKSAKASLVRSLRSLRGNRCIFVELLATAIALFAVHVRAFIATAPAFI